MSTDSQIFVAGPSVGGNFGKEGKRGEEQEEHARRMRRNLETRMPKSDDLRVQHCCCKSKCHNPCYSSEGNRFKSMILPSNVVTPPEGISHTNDSLCRIAIVKNASVYAKVISSAINTPKLGCSPHQQLFLFPY